MINEKRSNEYQVKIPERVANNFLSIYIQSDGMITIYWDDSKEDAGMNETRFPYGEIADRYADEFILPWFQRCMMNIPIYITAPMDATTENRVLRGYFKDWHEWYKKWFSQFIIKDEDEND